MSSPAFRKIRTFPSALLMAIVLQGAVSATASEPVTNNLDGFKEIKLAPDNPQADSLIGTILPYLLDHPENDESTGKMDLQVRNNKNGYQIDIIKDGYLDDSIRGEHFKGRVIFTADGRWELISMHVKQLCYRGQTENGLCR